LGYLRQRCRTLAQIIDIVYEKNSVLTGNLLVFGTDWLRLSMNLPQQQRKV